MWELNADVSSTVIPPPSEQGYHWMLAVLWKLNDYSLAVSVNGAALLAGATCYCFLFLLLALTHTTRSKPAQLCVRVLAIIKHGTIACRNGS